MKELKKYQIAVLFYLLIIGFTFIISARVSNLESRGDYLKYTNDVALNYMDYVEL